MSFRALLTVNGLAALIYGVGALLTPTMMLTMHAMNANPDAQLMVRYFGACLLGFAVLSWLSRDTTDAVARRAITLAFLVFHTTGAIVSAIGTVTGVMGPFGWSVVALLALLGLGFAYLQFKPASRAK